MRCLRSGRGRAASTAATAMVALGALLAGAPCASATPADPRLQSVETFALAIGNRTLNGDLATRYDGFDLVVFDGQEAKPHQIATLQAQGTLVLGYLSVGTIEKWRPWYAQLKPYRLEAWKAWKDEFYADVSKRGFRRQMVKRIAPGLLDKGFDGLFLDNTDMIENHRSETTGMRKLIKQLSGLVDSRGGLLFAQNGADVVGPSLPYFDGWNREDVSFTYDFDHKRYAPVRPADHQAALDELTAIGAQGLLVTATDYVAEGDGDAEQEAIANACAVGALPYVSDIGLRRVPANPFSCP